MFNLMRKDMVLQKKTVVALLLAMGLYILLDVSSIWIGVVFSIVIFMTTFSQDEKSNIDLFLNSLPYTRKEIVSSKYMVVILFTCIVAAFLVVGNLVIHRDLMSWKDLVFMMTIVLTAASVIIPFCYKFKSQYLMIGSIIAFGVYLLVISFVVPNLNDLIRNAVQLVVTTEQIYLYLLMSVAVIVLYAGSWLLSVRIYRKKVF